MPGRVLQLPDELSPDALRKAALDPAAQEAMHREELARQQTEEKAKRTATIWTDTSPFAVWLRSQQQRRDRIGALARVAVKDPFWPTGASRERLARYFQEMGARDFVMQSVRMAWDEFSKVEKRERARTKNRQKNKQRKATRRAQRR